MSIVQFLCWLENFDKLVNAKYNMEVLITDDGGGEQFTIHSNEDLLRELLDRNIGLLNSKYTLSIMEVKTNA